MRAVLSMLSKSMQSLKPRTTLPNLGWTPHSTPIHAAESRVDTDDEVLGSLQNEIMASKKGPEILAKIIGKHIKSGLDTADAPVEQVANTLIDVSSRVMKVLAKEEQETHLKLKKGFDNPVTSVQDLIDAAAKSVVDRLDDICTRQDERQGVKKLEDLTMDLKEKLETAAKTGENGR